MSKLTPQTKILIVGLGLIGGSYAKALTAKGYKVTAITKEESDIAYAVAEGFIERGAAYPDPALIAEADLIVLSLYPSLMADWVKENQVHMKAGAILTDTAGVKGDLVKAIAAVIRPDIEFIGAHPMAGREKSGVMHSDPAIFQGANYIVVPTPKNSEGAIALCAHLGEELGFAKISRLDPASHDRIIGFVSQLTHCIAIALMTANQDEHLQDYTGDSFRDLTRIARINERLWSELFLTNKEALIGELDAFSKELQTLREHLVAEDTDAIEEMMRYATARRALFDKK
jgi:prephenate dehydrogenase